MQTHLSNTTSTHSPINYTSGEGGGIFRGLRRNSFHLSTKVCTAMVEGGGESTYEGILCQKSPHT